ncbi:MAG: response regulator [Endomicrobiales bacterium]|nr:response regulator [Endomicrobiales bacterium]
MKETKLIVVDDDPGIRQACMKALEVEGYDVRGAESGESAMEILKKEQFDVVITDLQMPGISGIELLEGIKYTQTDCDVIVITAFPSFNTAIEALRAGVYDYIKKPIDINDFRKRIKECITLRAQKVNLTDEKGEEVLSLYQISKICNVSLTTITNWIEQGFVSAYETPNGDLRVRKKDLFNFFKQFDLPTIILEKDQ